MSVEHWVVTVHRDGELSGTERFHTRRELMEAVAAMAGSLPREGRDSVTIYVRRVGR